MGKATRKRRTKALKKWMDEELFPMVRKAMWNAYMTRLETLPKLDLSNLNNLKITGYKITVK